LFGIETRAVFARYRGMGKKQEPEDEPKDQPSRTDEARQVADAYAKDQREILKTLRKPSN
jgi:hypothetical protein